LIIVIVISNLITDAIWVVDRIIKAWLALNEAKSAA
jgi:uncharacterized membrane protein